MAPHPIPALAPATAGGRAASRADDLPHPNRDQRADAAVDMQPQALTPAKVGNRVQIVDCAGGGAAHNTEIKLRLQESGVAVITDTTIRGCHCPP